MEHVAGGGLTPSTHVPAALVGTEWGNQQLSIERGEQACMGIK